MQYQKITVGGLLYHKNKVLIIRRSSKESYLTGFYELPGGKVDFGDSPEQSLEREFLEEVNLKVKAVNAYRIFTYVDGDRHTVELVYFVKLNDDAKNLKLSEEHDDFKWVSAEELDSIKMSDEIKTNIRIGIKKLS